MIDSGWYRHPFFTQRGYHSNPVELGPASENPETDENGHGTGESANIFAVAPDVNFTMVKVNFVNSIGALNRAIDLRPDVISCSWGSSKRQPPLSASDRALSAAIANAVRQGITVVFSAGNGHWGSAAIRDILKSTARDVTAGNASESTGGNAATPGPDLATGHGLIDAYQAISQAIASKPRS